MGLKRGICPGGAATTLYIKSDWYCYLTERNHFLDETASFRRIPLGRMDVFAPMVPGSTVKIFPYQAAEAMRNLLAPGDTVFVGVEALATSPGKAGSQTSSAEIKVKKLINW